MLVCKHSRRLNNLKIKSARNTKISGFVIHVEAIIYLLLHDLHHSTFNEFLSTEKNIFIVIVVETDKCFGFIFKLKVDKANYLPKICYKNLLSSSQNDRLVNDYF